MLCISAPDNSAALQKFLKTSPLTKKTDRDLSRATQSATADVDDGEMEPVFPRNRKEEVKLTHPCWTFKTKCVI